MNFNTVSENKEFQSDNKILFALLKQLILIIILAIIIFFVLPSLNIDENSYLLYLARIGSITFFVSVYIYYKAVDLFICPYIVFYFSFFIFQFGQWFLLSFNIKYDYIHLGYYSSLWDNNMKILLNGTIFIIFAIALFNLGGLFALLFSKKRKISTFKISNDILKKSGWILFFVSIIPTLYNRINEMLVSIRYGYTALYVYTYKNITGISSLDILFIPSCILLLITYKNNKKMKRIIEIIMLLFSALWLLGGGRTEGVSIVLVLLIFNISTLHKINIKKMMSSIIIILITVTLISTFSNYRDEQNKTFETFNNALIENTLEKNPLITSVGEMGWSMGTVFMTMKIVPYYVDYNYGKSYIYSLSRLIPSIFDINGTISNLHTKASYAGNLVTDFYNSSFGMDSTLISESYYNFGYYGVICIFVLGIIIGKILGYRCKKLLINNDLTMYVKLAGLFAIFTLPRRQFAYLVTQSLYILIFIPLFIIIIKKINRQKI